MHMALALDAAELPPFISLKKKSQEFGFWELIVLIAKAPDINVESRNIDTAMFLLSRLLLGNPQGLNNTIS